MTVVDRFPPLQGAIAHAESWTSYLNARHDEMGGQRPEDLADFAENIVWIGVHLGASLPFTWRLSFDNLFRRNNAWNTVKEFETIRQATRGLFFTAREAMDKTRLVAESLQGLTGKKPAGMDRLLEVLEDARQLEEAVFRDWPSFAEPSRPGDSLPVDESLAEALGITVEEARRKLESRRRALKTDAE